MIKKKKKTPNLNKRFHGKFMKVSKNSRIVFTIERNSLPAMLNLEGRGLASVSRKATDSLRLKVTLLGCKTKMRRVTVQFGSHKPVLTFDLIGQSGTSVSLPIPALGRKKIRVTVQKLVFMQGFDADSVLFDTKDQHIKTVGKAGKSKLGLKPKPGSRIRRGTIGVVVEKVKS